MNAFNADDPKWTAYVLNELTPDDRAACDAELAVNPAAQACVAELRDLTQLLAGELQAEPCPELTTEQRTRVLTVPAVAPAAPFWLKRHAWKLTGIAAALLIGAGILLPAFAPPVKESIRHKPSLFAQLDQLNAENQQLRGELSQAIQLKIVDQRNQLAAVTASDVVEKVILEQEQLREELAQSRQIATQTGERLKKALIEAGLLRNAIATVKATADQQIAAMQEDFTNARFRFHFGNLNNHALQVTSQNQQLDPWVALRSKDVVSDRFPATTDVTSFRQELKLSDDLLAEHRDPTFAFTAQVAGLYSPLTSKNSDILTLGGMANASSPHSDICYTVCKPVWETKNRDICYTICKPTYENRLGDYAIGGGATQSGRVHRYVATTGNLAQEQRGIQGDNSLARESQTGKLMFGVGVNSDAGIVGNIVLDETNFDGYRGSTAANLTVAKPTWSRSAVPSSGAADMDWGKRDKSTPSGNVDFSDQTQVTGLGVGVVGAANLDLSPNSIVLFTDGAQFGTVTLNKTGSGTLRLSGANTYTGATSITAGSLATANSAHSNGYFEYREGKQPLSRRDYFRQGGANGKQADFDPLVDLITSTVKPNTWESTPGIKLEESAFREIDMNKNRKRGPTVWDDSASMEMKVTPRIVIQEEDESKLLGVDFKHTAGDLAAIVRDREKAGKLFDELNLDGVVRGEKFAGADDDLAFRIQHEASNTNAFDHIKDNEFLGVQDNPLSTFSADVDTGSYSIFRGFVMQQRKLPPPGAVRIEEMLNYFHYDYTPPKDDVPFAVHTEVAGCPWNGQHRLLKIGLKGKEIPKDQRPASNLVFLIDVSGSMQPQDRLPLVKDGLKAMVNELSEKDRVAIVVYAGSSGLVLPSTKGDLVGKRKILDALDRLEAGGSTNGAQGIQLAYETASQNFIKEGSNRVILATDGDFNVGVTSQDELVRLIEAKAKTGTFLTCLGVGYGNLKDSTLEKLADKGNGNYAYLDDLLEAKKVLVDEMSGTLHTIAKDVKLQLEFNPGMVAAYRLIGYENRVLAKEDFNNDKKDAGDIGAGHTVTALYEVVLAPADTKPAPEGQPTPAVDPLKYQKKNELTVAAASGELLTLKLRYKQPDGEKSKLIEHSVKDEGKPYGKASPDFKFASAVAAYGMILRNSPYKGTATIEAVLELAGEGLAKDDGGYRHEFVELVKQSKALGY